jgi:hypothetical protein
MIVAHLRGRGLAHVPICAAVAVMVAGDVIDGEEALGVSLDNPAVDVAPPIRASVAGE